MHLLHEPCIHKVGRMCLPKELVAGTETWGWNNDLSQQRLWRACTCVLSFLACDYNTTLATIPPTLLVHCQEQHWGWKSEFFHLYVFSALLPRKSWFLRLSSLRTRIAVLWPQYFQHRFHKRTEFRTYFLNILWLVNEKWDYLTFYFSVSLIPWAAFQTDCSNEQSVTVSYFSSFFSGLKVNFYFFIRRSLLLLIVVTCLHASSSVCFSSALLLRHITELLEYTSHCTAVQAF